MNTKTSKLILSIGASVLLVACGAPIAVAPTAVPDLSLTTPTAAASPTAPITRAPTAQPTETPVPSPRVAVQMADGSVQLVDLNGKITTLARTTAHFEIGKTANVIGNTIYAVTVERGEVYAIDAKGARRLEFIPGSIYGFAATAGHGGGTEHLAWGSALLAKNSTAEIVISAPNGTDRKSVVKESFTGEPRVLMPMQWSPDGTQLYYGKEPAAIGGYILFDGASSLWSLNLADGSTVELLKEGSVGGMLCIDRISPNGQWAATHCSQKYIRIFSLNDPSRSVRVSPPGDMSKFGQLGSAEFNPNSTRIAYAAARGEPDHEQGWVLVSDRLSGSSRVVAESAANEHVVVVGWLDADTILVQSRGQQPAVWMVRADGSSISKFADGTFLALIPITQK